MSRLKNFDHRALALAYHADHLLPVLQRLAPDRSLHSMPDLTGLIEKEPEVLKELLSRAAEEPDVRETADLQEAVEALRAPETFEVKPVRAEARAPRKTNEIRARVEPSILEAFRAASEKEGLSESEALRAAVRLWCLSVNPPAALLAPPTPSLEDLMAAEEPRSEPASSEAPMALVDDLTGSPAAPRTRPKAKPTPTGKAKRTGGGAAKAKSSSAGRLVGAKRPASPAKKSPAKKATKSTKKPARRR